MSAQEGWRLPAVTVVLVMIGSVDQDDATALRLSLGQLVNCVLQADTGRTAKSVSAQRMGCVMKD